MYFLLSTQFHLMKKCDKYMLWSTVRHTPTRKKMQVAFDKILIP